jgi:hypothetical protein
MVARVHFRLTPSPARADTPHGDYSNRHTARFITITDTTMEVEGDVMRTKVACRKRTAERRVPSAVLRNGYGPQSGSRKDRS